MEPALDSGLQQLLAEIAENYVGVSSEDIERNSRACMAEALLSGESREQVADRFGCPLAEIPLLLTTAPKTLQ